MDNLLQIPPDYQWFIVYCGLSRYNTQPPSLSAKTVKGNQLGSPFFMPINQGITNVTAS